MSENAGTPVVGRIYSFDTEFNDEMVGQRPEQFACGTCEHLWWRYVTPGKRAVYAHPGEGECCPTCSLALRSIYNGGTWWVARARTSRIARFIGREDRTWLERHYPPLPDSY